ncbi:MAG: 50S ribosomal protein L22 [Nitrosarchaeum sp.]|nr:50S ribosomal protein L22 [Nitrosarchaeum sp.]
MRYTYQKDAAGTARVMGKDLSVSTKQAIELCSVLRGLRLAQARRVLEDAKALRRAIPFRRYSEGAGHKPGIGMGKFAVKASGEFLKLLGQAEANASQRGLSSDLQIVHLVANKAASPMHYGRHRGREMKRTHIEIVVREVPGAKRSPAKKSVAKEGVVGKAPAVAKETGVHGKDDGHVKHMDHGASAGAQEKGSSPKKAVVGADKGKKAAPVKAAPKDEKKGSAA